MCACAHILGELLPPNLLSFTLLPNILFVLDHQHGSSADWVPITSTVNGCEPCYTRSVQHGWVWHADMALFCNVNRTAPKMHEMNRLYSRARSQAANYILVKWPSLCWIARKGVNSNKVASSTDTITVTDNVCSYSKTIVTPFLDSAKCFVGMDQEDLQGVQV